MMGGFETGQDVGISFFDVSRLALGPTDPMETREYYPGGKAAGTWS
jgi:hypothetical protein